MTTLDDCVRNQSLYGILAAPTDSSSSTSSSTTTTVTNTVVTPAAATVSAATASTSSTLQIALQNNTTSDTLYAYVTGLDLDNDSAVWMLESDGSTSYFPANPSGTLQPLQADVSISVGPPGSVKTVTVPHLAAARIWFCQDETLTFYLNEGTSGPGLVEPSVTNTTDPNYAKRWDFCEFTYNSSELFANITYVDFVSIPVALELTSTDGSATQTVEGLPSNGLSTICEALQAQQRVDCAGWDQLVVQITTSTAGTSFLRALSPYNGMVMNSSLFSGYFAPYVDQVWSQYATTTLTVETQASWGTVTAAVDSDDELSFSGVGAFPKPSTGDIFSCSTGAFAAYTTNTAEMANLTARLAAALNRSTLLAYANQPDGAVPADYYQTAITNHYARIVHAANLDGRGYAFPYDDVAPTDGTDQSGAVASSAPSLFTVYIGGGDASGAAAATTTKARSTPIRLRDMARRGRQLVGGRHHPHPRPHQHRRRALPSPPPSEAVAELDTMAPFTTAAVVDVDVDEKTLLQARERAASDAETTVDLEKGSLAPSAKSDVPAAASAPAAPAAPAAPDLATRLALLLHQALVYLWAALCGLGRSAWALVPRRVAAPVGALGSRIAAAPAVKAAAASVSSFASSIVQSAAASAVAAMLIRPLVVRAVLTAAVLLVTYAATAGGSAGASPMLASAVATMTGWVEGLTGSGQPAALLA